MADEGLVREMDGLRREVDELRRQISHLPVRLPVGGGGSGGEGVSRWLPYGGS